MCEDCRKHVCKICGKTFGKISNLSLHLKIHHKNDIVLFYGDIFVDYMIQYEGFEVPSCPVCGDCCKRIKGVKFDKTCGSRKCVSSVTEDTILDVYHVKGGLAGLSVTDTIKNKIKKTNRNKFGFDCPLQSPIVKERSRQTCNDRYGVDNYAQTEDFNVLSRRTCNKNWGADSFPQSDTFKSMWIERALHKCLKKFNGDFDNIHIERGVVVGTCKKCGHVEVLNTHNSMQRKRIGMAPVCNVCFCEYSKSKLKEQKTFCNFIRSVYHGEIIENDRRVLKGCGKRGLELDVFIPEMNLAFEFQGELYHGYGKYSSEYRRKLDLLKIKSCDDIGIKLIQVWENDWINNTDDVKSMVRGVLYE